MAPMGAESQPINSLHLDNVAILSKAQLGLLLKHCHQEESH